MKKVWQHVICECDPTNRGDFPMPDMPRRTQQHIAPEVCLPLETGHPTSTGTTTDTAHFGCCSRCDYSKVWRHQHGHSRLATATASMTCHPRYRVFLL